MQSPWRAVAYRALALLLGPLLLLQGRRVRTTTPKLPEAAGPRSGRRPGAPPGDDRRALRLLLLGDSAAAGVGVETQSEALLGRILESLDDAREVTWTVEAESGFTTRDTLARLGSLEPARYDAVVVSLGVNDVTRLRSLDTFEREQARLVDLLVARFSCRHVVLSELPPVERFPALPQPLRWVLGSRAREFSERLRRLGLEHPACDFVELDFAQDRDMMASDGFHPGAPVYRLWGRTVAARIAERELRSRPDAGRDATVNHHEPPVRPRWASPPARAGR